MDVETPAIPATLLTLPPELAAAVLDALLVSDVRDAHWTSWRSAPHDLDVDWNPLRAQKRDVLNLFYATVQKGTLPAISEVCLAKLWETLRLFDSGQVARLESGIDRAGFGAKAKKAMTREEPRQTGRTGFFEALSSLFFGRARAIPPPVVQPRAPTTPIKPPTFPYASFIARLRIDQARGPIPYKVRHLSGRISRGFEPGPSEQDTLALLLRKLPNLEHLTLGHGVGFNTADNLLNLLAVANGATPAGRAKLRSLEILESNLTPASGELSEITKVWSSLFELLPNLSTVWFPHWSPPPPEHLFSALEQRSGKIERFYVVLNRYSADDIVKTAKLVAGSESENMPELIEEGAYPRKGGGQLREFVLYARPRIPNSEDVVNDVASVLCSETRIEELVVHATLPIRANISDERYSNGHKLKKLTVTGSYSDSPAPQIPGFNEFVRFLANYAVEELYLRQIAAWVCAVDPTRLPKEKQGTLKLRVFSCMGGLFVSLPPHGIAGVPEVDSGPPLRIDKPAIFNAWMIKLSSYSLETVEIVDNMGAETADEPGTHLWNGIVSSEVMDWARKRRGSKLKLRVGSYGFDAEELVKLARFIAAEADAGHSILLRLDVDVQAWAWETRKELCLALRIVKYRRLLIQAGKEHDNVFGSFGPVLDSAVAELFRLTIGGEVGWREFTEAWWLVRGRGGELPG